MSSRGRLNRPFEISIAWLQARIPLEPMAIVPAAIAGAVCVSLAVLVRLIAEPLVEDHVPFITFFPAILVAAVWGGAMAGIAALLLSIATTWYWLLDTTLRHLAPGLILVFALAGLMIVIVALLIRAALVKLRVAQHNAEQTAMLAQQFAMEIEHRLKNVLTIVQALAHNAIKESESLSDFSRRFMPRLMALAAAHTILRASQWNGAEVGVIVDHALTPFRDDAGTRLRVRDGSPVRLSANSAVSLALSLNELATNAIKHGALSTPGGYVTLRWTFDDSTARLCVLWEEHGAPPPAQPMGTGIGSKIIAQTFSTETERDIQYAFGADGLRCILCCTLKSDTVREATS